MKHSENANTIPEVNWEEGLITRREAAQFLYWNFVTLWRYTREGKTPCYRVGRKMFFKKSEILAAARVTFNQD